MNLSSLHMIYQTGRITIQILKSEDYTNTVQIGTHITDNMVAYN
jgi:hypothetical protein